ncbi:hypothetical protein R3W88_032294 [Solanum pinnatisectum]|uniref:Uncharacterized protein n=1 Tax=Solanum pinnatisectum TaxID=50273 RepID=A0AAV9LSP2_9SOLN|nr:hypothetical protein R3W88_032294 [Solanum pinnatisectum]
MAFEQTTKRFKCVNVSSSCTSAPAPEWQQEMASMKSQLNVLLSLYPCRVCSLISTSSTGED